jgi:hypothetical protein
MGRRSKNPAGGVVIFIVVGIVALIASIPPEAWIVIAVIATIGFIIWLINTKKSQVSQSTSDEPSEPPVASTLTYRVIRAERQLEQPRGSPIQPRWIPRDESVEVANTTIKGGMIYFGSDLRALSGEVEPALIEPRLTVSRTAAHYSQRQTDYWPSYTIISPDARRTYLSWLTSDRSDPAADVGYVFLFFYGLERRALVDAPVDPKAKADLPMIEAEVRRLLSIYSGNRSFRGYASSFLEYLTFQAAGSSIKASPPKVTSNSDLPPAMKVGLGRLATAGLPLSADWAFAWMQCDPRIGTSPIARRPVDSPGGKQSFLRSHCPT